MYLFTSILGLLWTFCFLFFGLVLLLPLLASRKLRENYFVFFYQFIDVIWADALAKPRRKTLSALDGLQSHDPQLRERGILRLLEIGAGTGANFKHITRPLKYTNVDPNQEFQSICQEELKKYPQIEMERWFQSYGEDMGELKDQHYDVVLLTYIFCSVLDPLKVLKEAKRVLVKGGRLIYLEHVGYPKGTWERLWQDVVNPLWKVVGCNCHVNRDCHQDLIKKAGFENVTCNYIVVDMPTLINRHVYGEAVA